VMHLYKMGDKSENYIQR